MALSILLAKLQRPRVGPQSVPRQRLLDRLDAAFGVPFTLLSAPAGFGKTSLVAEWLAHRAPLPAPPPSRSPQKPAPRAAWLALDPDDNDPVRFWAYVAAAFQAQQVPGLSAPLDDLLAQMEGPQPPPLNAIVEMLLHALAGARSDLLLVLDDYQHIHAQPVHDTLYSFIARLPAQAHVLLLTRADPPLPLQRWRVYGQMAELRARDLCFSVEEAGAMLSRRTRVVLPQETIELLLEHTDGWPAGLHLLAASLQGRSAHETAALVAGFAGSNRYVLNYLLEEVLQSQPAPVRDFLLRTSILSRFNAALCDALLAETDPALGGAEPAVAATSAAILGDLEAANLFLVPLDDNNRWFRYYHLFAEALHAELHRRAPGLDLALHRRAARWYAAHGSTADAIEQALHAGDVAFAGDILNRCAYDALLAGEFPALYRWTDALPEEIIRARPRLALTRGWLLLFRGPLHTVQTLVDDLADAIGEVGMHDDVQGNPAPGEPVALRAMLAAFRWEVPRALALCAEAERLLPRSDFFSLAAVHQAAGLACLMAGRTEDATQEFQQAAEYAQQLGSAYMVLFPAFRLAQCAARAGRLREAAQIYRRHLQAGYDRGGAHWPILADGLIGMADVLREHNDLLAAEHYVRRGLVLAPQRNVEVWAWGRAVQARISAALGRRDGAMLELQEAVRQAIAYNNQHLTSLLRAHQARLDLAAGDLNAARQWAQADPGLYDGGYLPEFEALTRARVYLAERRPRAALALLDEWQARAEAGNRLRALAEIGVLRALALAALGQRNEALESLRRALDLAEAENMQRIFLDEGPALAPLLDLLAPVSEFAARLAAALQDDGAARAGQLSAPLDRLTPRELEVLRALARGASNQEIAETYVLTVGTVKGHVNHILSKLGARNRTEAVAHGRELGLL